MADRETDLELFAKQRIGRVLRGKYRLDRLLGVGGMAVVYKATHRNQAEFAVKMLHPELSIREDVRARFLREGYAANSVKHPGAVLVVDDDVAEDGAAFLVMELLDGAPVEALWQREGERMAVRASAAIVSQLLDVLAAAHAKGIVHRDIKPANLFVLRDGTVKVLDFGIARARDALASGASSTGTGILLGTPAFMPPEQAMAKSSEIDGQTDLWAAGATLFTLLSGRVVHEGENATQLMIRAATTPARALATVAPGVPQALARVIDRALAFEKAARWPNATAMRQALDEACREALGGPPSKAHLAAMMANDVAVASGDLPRGARTISEAPAPEHPEPAALPSRDAPAPFTGRTTAQPVSHEAPPTPLAVRSGKRLWIAIASTAAAVLLFVVWLIARGAPRGAPSAAVASPPRAEAPTAMPSSVFTPLPVAPAEPPSPLDVPAPSPAAPRDSPPARAAPKVVGASPAAAPVRPAPPASKPRPNCDPNYVLDSEGNRHFKPECFQ